MGYYFTFLLGFFLIFLNFAAGIEYQAPLSKDRFVFQTSLGDIHMAFYSGVAPKTVALIRMAVELGCYNSNHFFRIDKGFVAQTADVFGGRSIPLSPLQKQNVEVEIPLEVQAGIKHNKRGVLSIGRHSDPNSGGTSFSILLGPAPHLDMEYTIFGEVTSGWDVLERMEEVETIREGIFVMPKERISIISTYTYIVDGETEESATVCSIELLNLQQRFEAQALAFQRLREKHLP